MKQELAVAALKNGTVIDHIPAAALFKAVKILDLSHCPSAVTIGNNLPSKRLGSKGIIKVADIEYPEQMLNRVAFIAPGAVVNIVRDYTVVEKRPVELGEEIVNIVRCPNPKCISNNEPMKTRFHVDEKNLETGTVMVSCHYCGHTVDNNTAKLV